MSRTFPVPSFPHLWRGDELGAESHVLPTGHPSLDLVLPGGGWPIGALIDLVLRNDQVPVWQLLLPSLARWILQHAGTVVLVGPPWAPFPAGMAAQGLPAERLLWVRGQPLQGRLWAAEQATRCQDVAAVLAWLPGARATDLRRLHLPAGRLGQLLFVCREWPAVSHPSPARLRLGIECAGDCMQVRILKRRGPPVDAPVLLPAHSSQLDGLLASRRSRSKSIPTPSGGSHVLDRVESLP